MKTLRTSFHSEDSNSSDAPSRQLDKESQSFECQFEILMKIRPRMLATAKRVIGARGNPEFEAEDVVQNVCLNILKARKPLKHVSNQEGYFVQCAKHEAIRRLKAYAARQRVYDTVLMVYNWDVKMNGPSDEAAAEEEVTWLMSRLSDRDREVISLILDGISFRDAAKRLKVSTRTCRRAIHRVQDRVRYFLDDDPTSECRFIFNCVDDDKQPSKKPK